MAEAATPNASYDVVIIGGGPGGYNAAIPRRPAGPEGRLRRDARDLGGTCLNVGCMPSKALLHASELFEAVTKEFPTLGIDVGAPKLNLAQMMGRKQDSVNA